MTTVTNLLATLKEIGATIDRDDDVVMVYLESHGGRDHRLAAEFPPLELEQLTPETLRTILDEAAIKWRIIVVSACYSGGYIEPLKDDFTLILTASATDRTSFGCGTESNATYFADALFQHALRFEDSFVKAFAQARERKVEPAASVKAMVGDPVHQWRLLHDAEAIMWYVHARNNVWIGADLHMVEGHEVARSLPRDAEDSIETYHLGTLEKWGLCYDTPA